MSTKEKISVKPIIIAFALIGFFTWLYDFAYEEIWKGAGWAPLDPQTALIYGIGVSAAIAFTVAYVANFRAQRFTKLFDNFKILKIEGREIISPPNEKPFHVSTIVGYLSVPATIAFASGLSIGYSNQPITVISIFLGSIAIGLSIAIFAIQQNQNSRIKEILDDVRMINDSQSKILNEFKDVREKRIHQYSHRKSQILNTIETELNKIMKAYNEKKFPLIFERVKLLHPFLISQETYLNRVYGDLRIDAGELNWVNFAAISISAIPNQLEPDQTESINNLFNSIQTMIKNAKEKLSENTKGNTSGFYIG